MDTILNTQALHPASPLGQRNILLVDDDFSTLLTIQNCLEKRQFTVYSATSAEQALQLLRDVQVQLLLIDVCLPQQDGFDLCQEIRMLPGYEHTPIYMLTGLTDSSSIDKAFMCGADDYIAKPIDLRILGRRLEVAFDNLQVSTQLHIQQTSKQLLDSFDFVVAIDNDGRFIRTDLQNATQPVLSLLAECETAMALFARTDVADQPLSFNPASQSSLTIMHDQRLHCYKVKFLQLTCGQRYVAFDDVSNVLNIPPQRTVDVQTGLADKASLHNDLDALVATADTKPFGIAVLFIANMRQAENALGQNSVQQELLKLSKLLKLQSAAEAQACQWYRGSHDLLVLINPAASIQQFTATVQSLGERVRSETADFKLSLMLGFCHSSQLSDGAKMLYAMAELAALSALERNKEEQLPVIGFVDDMLNSVRRRSMVEQLLLRDIDAFSLEVHFQPKFDAKSLTLTGMEALVRWPSPELGMVSPGEFIPLAEATNLMNPLSLLVVDKTLAQIKQWQQQGRHLVPVSINLDNRNLSDNKFIDQFIERCIANNIEPRLLEVEVTENVIVYSDSVAVRNLHRLREFGIGVAIDDFGTGYSSLRYLKDLPADTLKIDMSFIRQLETNTKAESIVKAMIAVGHEMGLKVVAEGVEHQSQLTKLVALECDTIQGFLTGKPVKANEFDSYFESSAVA